MEVIKTKIMGKSMSSTLLESRLLLPQLTMSFVGLAVVLVVMVNVTRFARTWNNPIFSKVEIFVSWL